MPIKGGLTYKDLLDRLISNASPEEKEMIYKSQIVAKVIKELDLVEVVRCKDCKWRGEPGCAVSIVDESDMPNDDDFCAWGERKEDE